MSVTKSNFTAYIENCIQDSIREHAKKTGKSVNQVTAERLIAGERVLEQHSKG
jgi:hypothetical protein